MINTVLDQVARMDSDELNRVVDAIKLRRTFIARDSARSLRIGDAVQFTGRRNETVTGIVKKINVKTVVVDAGYTQWKVPANLLSPAIAMPA